MSQRHFVSAKKILIIFSLSMIFLGGDLPRAQAREVAKVNAYNEPLVAKQVLAVMVNAADPSYTVFTSLATVDDVVKGTEWLTSLPPGQTKAKMYKWDEFLNILNTQFTQIIKINDYPKVDVKTGLIDLLSYYPNVPFGITFTSGIAYTRNDYNHTQQIYSIFSADPKKYESIRNSNFAKGSGDPINPLGHLKPLLMYDYPKTP